MNQSTENNKENVLLSLIGEDQLISIVESAVRKIMLELKEPAPEVNKWLTSEQVCQMLHISKSTLVNYRKRNVIASHKLEGKLLFRAEEILNKIAKIRQFKSVQESMN